MPSFQSDQGQLHYSTVGNEKGPKLLFLHGFLGSSCDFAPIVEQLSSEFYCISVDLPGHGKTKTYSLETGYQMPAVATNLTAFLDWINCWPCYLVGYSMGGRLALYLACHFPQYFSGMLLESASPGLAAASDRKQRQGKDEALAEKIRTSNWSDFVDEWYAQPLFASLAQHPSFEALIRARQDSRPAELARSLQGMGTGIQPSLWESLPRLNLPITLVVGALDSKFLTINKAMVERCSAARLVILPNCGHVVHAEAPDAFLTVLRSAALDVIASN